MAFTKALLIVAVGLCFSVISHAGTLRVATLNYPPFQYEEQGEVKGVAADLIREIFRRMDQPVEITVYPFQRAFKRIKEGSSDLIFTFYYRKDRERFAIYSREPLVQQTIPLFVRKDSPITFDGDLAKLSAHSFGMVRFSYGAILDEAVARRTIRHIDYASTMESNFKKFLKGRFEILPSDQWVARYYQARVTPKKTAPIKELHPAVESFPAYIGFSKARQLETLRDRVDATLREMKTDGTWLRIVESHIRSWGPPTPWPIPNHSSPFAVLTLHMTPLALSDIIDN